MYIRKTIKILSLRNVDKTLQLATHCMLQFITIKRQLDVWHIYKELHNYMFPNRQNYFL